jgi:hypothetical protein
MAHIKINTPDKSLIKAAIDLGAWLLSLDNLTPKQAQAVKSVQQTLSKLPKINDGTVAMYGFSIETGDDETGLVRGWDVSIEYLASDPEQQGGLELFSSYLPIPESRDPEVLATKRSHEVYFHWPVAQQAGVFAAEQVNRWISEVSQPEKLLGSADRLRVEVVFADQYVEIVRPLR